MGAKTAAGPSARERLLAAANELFYDEGVHTVGIDRVIERAGVLSLMFTVAYLGLGVPAVAAGFLTVHGAGLTGAARDYGAALIVLAALAFAALSWARRTATR